MKTLTRVWIAGWRIIGRLALFWIACLLITLLFSLLRAFIQDTTIRIVVGMVAFVCFAPFVAYRAAAASRVCGDIVDEDGEGRPASPEED